MYSSEISKKTTQKIDDEIKKTRRISVLRSYLLTTTRHPKFKKMVDSERLGRFF
jgi:hypothetical protein